MYSYIKHCGYFDMVIDLQGLIKSGVITYLLDSKLKIGFDYRSAKEGIASIFYHKKCHIQYQEHILERNLSLLNLSLDSHFTREDITKNRPFFTPCPLPQELKFLEQATESKKVLFVIEASRASKVYPKEYFVELANMIEGDIFIIYHNDRDSAHYITTHSKAKLLPRVSLKIARDIISQMDMVIGGDTGIVHLAWGVNSGSITLFSDTNPDRFCLKTPINRCLSVKNKGELLSSITPLEIYELYKEII